MNRLGFIGMGAMGSAIASGLIASKQMEGKNILAYAPHKEKLIASAERIGFMPIGAPDKLVADVDTVLIACKPYQIKDVLSADIVGALKGKNMLSIAAGWNIDAYREILGDGTGIQCIMPNTPAQIGEGVFLFEKENTLEPAEREGIMKMFEALGIVIELPTGLMGIGGAVTGCGPAFIDMMMEAYADAAVKYGIPRALAYQLVSQTFAGTARLQQATGQHPGVLKDAVCSPAGTTIRGVDALEHAGLRAACIDSIDAVMNKK
jgi:pyrroline-5-carboxylate reductase